MFPSASLLLSLPLQGLISDMRAPGAPQAFHRETYYLSWTWDTLEGHVSLQATCLYFPLGPLLLAEMLQVCILSCSVPPTYPCSSQTQDWFSTSHFLLSLQPQAHSHQRFRWPVLGLG